MATLEKIRSKSVLLLVVIGVALLAFIIGDFINSGSAFFGNRTTIASVNGKDIDIMAFQKNTEAMSQQAQQQGYKEDHAILQQRVLNQMIGEELYNQELDALGIAVTDKELSDAMIGANALPQMAQLAGQFGLQSASQLHDMAFNPTKYGIPSEQAAQIQQMWIEQEEQVEQMLRSQKLGNLIMGAITANELDAKALYDENASTVKIAYAKKDFTNLPNDNYEVSASDIKSLWNEEKNAYRLDEETRIVSYISVNITPSSDDRLAAQQAVESAVERLKEAPGTEGVANDILFTVDRINQPETGIKDNQLKNFAKTAAVDSVAITSVLSNEYTIAKLLGKKVEVDSVNVNTIVCAQAKADSIMNALNNGASFDDIAEAEGVQGSQKDTWFSLINETSPIKAKLQNEVTGKYFIGDSVQNVAVLYRINERKSPVTVYEIAKVNYAIEPSQNTINKYNNDLYNFITSHNSDTAFNSINAQAAGYQVLTANVTPSSPQISNIAESRDAVKWVMSSNKGDVSSIFSDQNGLRLLAVAINDIYDGEFVPAHDSAVKNQLTIKARNNKKAADLMAQYEGKATDLNGYAALMETAVDTADVTFGQRFIAGIGIDEAAIMGSAATAQPNKLVGPLKANNSVIVYSVIEVDNQSRPFDYEESAAMFNRQLGSDAIGNRFNQILFNGKKIENNILDFYNN